MQCAKCKKEAVICRRHEGRALCRRHFLESVEGNFRKSIRNRVGPKCRVAVDLSGGGSAFVLYQFSRMKNARKDIILSAFHAETEELRRLCREWNIPISRKKGDITVLPDSLDDEAESIITEYFGYGRTSRAGLKPASGIPKEEIELYLRLKGLHFREKKKDLIRKRIGEMLDRLDAKHPGLKFNVLGTKKKMIS